MNRRRLGSGINETSRMNPMATSVAAATSDHATTRMSCACMPRSSRRRQPAARRERDNLRRNCATVATTRGPRAPVWYHRGMHVIGVVALEGVVPFDLAIPCEVFGRTRLADGSAPYEVKVCGVERTVDAGAFTLQVPWSLRVLARADTIIVPGTADPTGAVPPAVLRALRAAVARGARVASI